MLSTYAIKSMGFTPIGADETIEAVFHSLHVFEVRGFTLKEEGIVSRTASVLGTDYTLAVGGSVNEICSTIIGDTYTEDEGAWADKHKCRPPYVVIHFGPTTLHTAREGYVKRDGEETITYDTFRAAREELRNLEAKALPSLEMALTCGFSSGDRDVQFKPIERTVFGITPSNATIHDIRVEVRASGHVSTPFSPAEVGLGLQNVVALAESVNPRVSRFFQLGLRDEDNLKEFLYYFLAIEVEVHRVFRTVSPAQHLQNGAALEPRISTSLARLFENRDNWTNLADQFVWCVVSIWTHLTDVDVEEFKRLKKVRDSIAHGDIESPDPAAVAAVEQLAKKIHRRGPAISA